MRLGSNIWGRHQQIKTGRTKKITLDSILGMLATRRFRIFCLLVRYLRIAEDLLMSQGLFYSLELVILPILPDKNSRHFMRRLTRISVWLTGYMFTVQKNVSNKSCRWNCTSCYKTDSTVDVSYSFINNWTEMVLRCAIFQLQDTFNSFLSNFARK